MKVCQGQEKKEYLQRALTRLAVLQRLAALHGRSGRSVALQRFCLARRYTKINLVSFRLARRSRNAPWWNAHLNEQSTIIFRRRQAAETVMNIYDEDDTSQNVF